MAKEIVKEDIPKIERLLNIVFGTEEYKIIQRMGGLTNHTYKVVLINNEEYVVRIPGEGTEEIIIRSDEKKSTELACKIGIDTDVLYFGEDGSKVTKYISDAITMSSELLCDEKRVQQVADTLKKLHSCEIDTGVHFEIFKMAEAYENIIFDNDVEMFHDYVEKKKEVMQIKREVDSASMTRKVPCHNDPLCENWVEGNGRMYLIDWEYAGMNDGMWDVADVSIEAGFNEEYDTKLLTAYLERKPDIADRKKFLAYKVYVDYLWTLWAKARVPYDGQPMEDWANERYARLKRFISEYKKL